MREIKFRAWDKTRNIYGQVLKLERPCGEMDMDFCGHAGRLSLFNPKNEYDCGFWGIWIEKADLEQFTGLHDKNGKEIYEGDIVKLCRSLGYQSNKGQIGSIDPDPVELGYLINRGYSLSRLTEPRSKHIEVIGNIHENPELAK